MADAYATHGNGSAVWTSAIGAALGDGIVPRTGTMRVAASEPRPRRRWFGRAPRTGEEPRKTV